MKTAPLWCALAVWALPCFAQSTLEGPRVNPGRYEARPRLALDGRAYDLAAAADQDRLAAELGRRLRDAELADDLRDAYTEMLALVDALRSDGALRRDRLDAQVHLQELADALVNETRSPAPGEIRLWKAPLFVLDTLINPVGRGRTAATNLAADGDPLPSTFWRRPAEPIAAREVVAGFGRAQAPSVAGEVCRYHKPKTSYGTHPGFEVKCGARKVKVKWEENSTEPFAGRLLHALGYNVEAADYTDGVTVAYDRRIFTEFNMRKPMPVTITTFWGRKLYEMDFQKTYSAFDFVRAATLADGRVLSGAELQRFVQKDGAFDPAAEARVATLQLLPSNFQVKDSAFQNVGPWDWNHLSHDGRRELRGLAIFAGWLNWFDARWDNTRLKLVTTADGRQELRHYISDVGGCLGKATHALTRSRQKPNDLPWTFTVTHPVRGFGLQGFRPIEDNAPFREMTMADARWMGRLIAGLTERQLAAALIASGMSSAEARIFHEKLVSRRDQMVRDLGLAAGVALLRPRGQSRAFDYRPARDGLFTVTLADGRVLTAPDRGDRVDAGVHVEAAP